MRVIIMPILAMRQRLYDLSIRALRSFLLSCPAFTFTPQQYKRHELFMSKTIDKSASSKSPHTPMMQQFLSLAICNNDFQK